MDLAQARQLARDADVDLVEVASNSDPPVCRLLDYGKLLYLTSKKERESKKGQRSTGQKEVRFRPNIGTHDLDSKTRKIREFIGDGSKVKLTVRFRGREAAHQQLGLAVLKRVADELKDEVRLERPPAMEGRALSMVLIPALPRTEKAAEEAPEDKKTKKAAVAAPEDKKTEKAAVAAPEDKKTKKAVAATTEDKKTKKAVSATADKKTKKAAAAAPEDKKTKKTVATTADKKTKKAAAAAPEDKKQDQVEELADAKT